MARYKHIILAITLSVLGCTVSGTNSLAPKTTGSEFQDNRTSDITFKYHLTLKGQTAFSIAQMYNITLQDLYMFNPEAEIEVLENEILRIPIKNVGRTENGFIKEDDHFIFHKVQPSEGLMSIARLYGADYHETRAANPQHLDILAVGTVVKVPKAKQENTEPTEEYFWHVIEEGDTYWNYHTRFQVFESELKALNPALKEGLNLGLRIKIPRKNESKVKTIVKDKDLFIEHTVLPKETLWGLSKLYDVEKEEIQRINPELQNRKPIIGETLYIPDHEKIKERLALNLQDTSAVYSSKQLDSLMNSPAYEQYLNESFGFDSGDMEAKLQSFDTNPDTVHIALMLPLFYERTKALNLQIDTILVDPITDEPIDTLYRQKTDRTLFAGSKNFIKFYQGFLVALADLEDLGVHTKLHVYDTQYKSSVVDSLIRKPEMRTMDLIVGPVVAKNQETVAQFAYKNKIPFISPLSSSSKDIEKCPSYFMVNSSNDYLLRKTSDYIGNKYYDKNIVVLDMGSYNEVGQEKMIERIKQKLFMSGYYSTTDEVLYHKINHVFDGNWGLKEVLRDDMENVVIVPLPKNGEAALNKAVNSLDALSDDFEITLMGLKNYGQYDGAITKQYHHLNLTFLSPYHVDYKKTTVKNFVRHYRSNFNDEPDNFGFQGYDIAMYFGLAANIYGDEIFEEISNFHCDRILQGDYNFQRTSAYGGYMNHTLNIINYTRNFEVINKGSITEGRTLVDAQ